MNDAMAARFALEMPLVEKTLLCELADDFVLPDYMPPIERVVAIEATALPAESYVGASGCELGGDLKYRLLYEGGESGGVWCAELPAEYQGTIHLDGDDWDSESVFCRAHAEAEQPSVRVSAPRKVSIRCRVRIRAAVIAKRAFECAHRGETVADDEIRCLEGRAKCAQTLLGKSDIIALSDSFSAEENAVAGEGEIRVVSCRAETNVTSVDANASGVNCEGEVRLRILLCRDSEGARPVSVTRRITFSGTADYSDQVHSGAQIVGACAHGCVISCNTSVADGHVLCEAEVVILAEALAEYSFSYLRDVYSLNNICETAPRKIATRIPVACFNANISVGGAASLDELKIDNGMKLLDVKGSAAPDITAEISDNRLSLSGKIRCGVIADDGAGLVLEDVEIPYKYTAELSGISPDAKISVSPTVSVVGCRGRFDADELAVDAELYVSVSVVAEREIDAVTEVRFGSLRRAADGSSRPAARITVCYPSVGESLWEIAKRYGADIGRIAADNGIDPSAAPDSKEALAQAAFLIV